MTSPAPRRRRAAVLVSLACVVALTGCGKGATTGTQKILNTKGPKGCGQIICETTPPPTHGPKVTPTKTHRATAAPTVIRTTKPPVRATQPAAKPFDIYINGDKSGKSLFDPPQAVVYAGTKVVFHNADSRPRGVKADNNGFNSGLIAPGAAYTWVSVPGNYAYSDLTRPYVTGQLQVAPRG